MQDITQETAALYRAAQGRHTGYAFSKAGCIGVAWLLPASANACSGAYGRREWHIRGPRETWTAFWAGNCTLETVRSRSAHARYRSRLWLGLRCHSLIHSSARDCTTSTGLSAVRQKWSACSCCGCLWQAGHTEACCAAHWSGCKCWDSKWPSALSWAGPMGVVLESRPATLHSNAFGLACQPRPVSCPRSPWCSTSGSQVFTRWPGHTLSHFTHSSADSSP